MFHSNDVSFFNRQPDFYREPCHYQVRTFLIFTNVLDKDLVCLLYSKNQEHMQLGIENICNSQWDRHV